MHASERYATLTKDVAHLVFGVFQVRIIFDGVFALCRLR